MLYYADTSFFTWKLVCSWHYELFGALKNKEHLNLTIFVLFSVFERRNIGKTYSKYFRKTIYATGISSASEGSITWCYFAEIWYAFNVCDRSLYWDKLQCVHMKKNWQFFVGLIWICKFTLKKIGFSKKK